MTLLAACFALFLASSVVLPRASAIPIRRYLRVVGLAKIRTSEVLIYNALSIPVNSKLSETRSANITAEAAGPR